MLMIHVLCANIKTLQKLKKTLNGDFENISNIFVTIKLNQFYSQVSEGLKIFLNIRYKEIHIKQQEQATYLVCVLDESMSGEPMVLKVINKINGCLRFCLRVHKMHQMFQWINWLPTKERVHQCINAITSKCQ